MTDRWDAVVVGAGPPGLVAGTVLARGGVRVLVLGNGSTPGEGGGAGLLSDSDLGVLAPDAPTTVPVERTVTERRWFLLEPRSSLSVTEQEPPGDDSGHRVHTVRRSKLGPWLVDRARAAGAEIRAGPAAERLLVGGSGAVEGVVVDQGKLSASVTILTEPVPSLSAVARPPDPSGTAGLEHRSWVTLGMEPGSLEQRFGLEPAGGAVFDALLGFLALPTMGRGFVWTHRDALTAGVAIRSPTGVDAASILDGFRHHPSMGHLLGEGPILESGTCARAIGAPGEYGRAGLLVAAEPTAMGFENLLVHSELGPGLRSAQIAALTALEGLKSDSTGASLVRAYRRRLRVAGLDEDRVRSRAAASRVEWNPRFHHEYPRLLTGLFHRMMTETSQPKEPMGHSLGAARKMAMVRRRDLARDLLRAGGSL